LASADKTFVGDTPRLVVNTGIDLSVYATLIIKFKRPNRTTGYWTASIDPADSTRMIYDLLVTDLNMPGLWVVQAHVEDTDVELHGLWADINVYEPLPETSTPPTTPGPTTEPW